MNTAAALLAPAANPLGLGSGAKSDGWRTIGGSESFLRELDRELAKPAKREGLRGTASERDRALPDAGIGPKGAPRRADDSEPQKSIEGGTAEDRQEAGTSAGGELNAADAQAPNGNSTQEGEATSSSAPSGVRGTDVTEAETQSGAAATEDPSRQAEPGATGNIDAASRARDEQASAARPLPADRPMTIRELNEALAMVDPAAWPKGMLRDLGIDRDRDRTSDASGQGTRRHPASSVANAAGADLAPATTPPSEQGLPVVHDETEPGTAVASKLALGARGDAGMKQPDCGDQATSRETGREHPEVAGARDWRASQQAHAWREHAAMGAATPQAGLDRTRRVSDAEEKPAATPPSALGRLERLSRTPAAHAASKPGERAADRPAASDMPFAAQVGRGVRAALDQGGEITLHLRPEALGSMRVSVDARETGVTVRFEVSEPDTASLVDRALEDLSKALLERGLNLEHVSVGVRPAHAESGSAQAGDAPADAGTWHADRDPEHHHQHSGDRGHTDGAREDSPRERLPVPNGAPDAGHSASPEGSEEMMLAWRLDTVV